MALSETELNRAKQLQKQGYTPSEVREVIGAQRAGRQSIVVKEMDTRQQYKEEIANRNLDWQKILGAPAKFLAPDAVDVFSDAIARRQSEAGSQYIDEPTARQYAGAVLQTAGLAADVGITVGSLGAAAPMTLGRNAAIGAGLGYVYDVGEDLVEQESMKDVLTPGFGTAVGGAAPVVFAGVGAGLRQMKPQVADDAGRAVAPIVRGTTDQVVDATTQKVASGVEEGARALGNRFTRAGRHLNNVVETNAERNALRQNARPAVSQALDDGIDTNTVTRIEAADDITRSAYRTVVETAEGADPKNAERVSGSYATQMYRIAREKQNEIGEALGNARRSLGNDIIDEQIYNPSMRTLGETMRNNGIVLKPNGTVEFNTSKFIDEEEKVISEIWARLAKYDTISPSEIDEVAQYLSKLEYRTNVTDKLNGVYIDVVDQKTGNVVPENIFRHIRNTYDNLLERVDDTGEIARLRREYSTVKGVTGRIENTWLNGIDVFKTSDEDLADAMSLALRRLDSRAKSRTTYGQMYRGLENYARSNGYKGPDASDVSEFYLSTVEPLYVKSTPEASFGGPFASLRGAIEGVIDFGKANTKDKQNAIKGLLDIENVAPQKINPTSNAEELFQNKGILDRAKEVLKDERGSASVGTPMKDKLTGQPGSRLNFNKLSDKGETVVSKFLRHMDGTDKLSGDELRIVLQDIQTIADNAGLARMGNESNEMLAKALADKFGF